MPQFVYQSRPHTSYGFTFFYDATGSMCFWNLSISPHNLPTLCLVWIALLKSDLVIGPFQLYLLKAFSSSSSATDFAQPPSISAHHQGTGGGWDCSSASDPTTYHGTPIRSWVFPPPIPPPSALHHTPITHHKAVTTAKALACNTGE